MSDFRFSGFSQPNYTQTPNELFDQLLPHLNEGELKVLLYIIRRTFGFQRETDNISLSQMVDGLVTSDGRRLDNGVGLSKSAVARALQGLTTKGVILSERNRDPVRGDLPTTVYTLTRKGYRYVRDYNDASGRFEAPEPYFLRHTVEANDLLIQCHQLERQDSRTQLVAFATERELKRAPGYTRIQGKRTAIVPDGWCHLQRLWRGRDTPNNHYICWELDRGTIQQRSFRRKIRNLVSWIDDGYEARFGVQGINLAFVTTHSQNRANEMVSWAEAELQDSPYAEFFLFSYYQPERLFFDSIWSTPYSEDYTALLVPP